MKNKRRDFLKLSGLAGLTLAAEGVLGNLKSEPDQSAVQNMFTNSKLEGELKDYQSNDQIKADFELAKNILKPTPKQLERGIRPRIMQKYFGMMDLLMVLLPQEHMELL